jgi:hypothetical protein
MYSVLLTTHSWLRWLALLGVIIVLIRAIRGATAAAPWTRSDLTWAKGAAHLLTLQVLIGIVLYIVSPYVRSLMDNMGATMKDKTSRFFAVEHAVVMIVALGLTHIGTAKAKKAQTDGGRHKSIALFFGIALLLIAYGIPWARPLFRP